MGICFLTPVFSLQADELRPALLETNERDGAWVDVLVRVNLADSNH